MNSVDQLGICRQLGGKAVLLSLQQGEGEGLFRLLSKQFSEGQGQLVEGGAFILRAQTAVHDFLEFGGHGDGFQFAGADEVDELPLLVCSGEGAEKKNDDHGKTEDISAVVVLLRRRLLRGTEQLGPHTLTELLFAILFDFPSAETFFYRGLPVLRLPGQAEVDEFAAAVADHHVVQLHITVDDPLGVQVAEPSSDVQCHLIVLPPVPLFSVPSALQVAVVEEGLQVHLAQLAQDVHPCLLIVRQFLAGPWEARSLVAPTFVCWFLFAFCLAAEDEAIGAEGVIAYDHLKLLLLLSLLHLRHLLLRKRLEFHPGCMVLEDLRVCQLRVHPHLCQGSVELFLRFILIAAQPHPHYLGSIDSSIQPTPHSPHLCESAASDTPEVLKVRSEALSQREVPAAVRFSNSQSLAFIIDLEIIDGRQRVTHECSKN